MLRGMWTVVRDHLVVKIALVVVSTLVLGFAVPAALNARAQLAEMEQDGRSAAENVAQGLAAGVRTAMLSGNGITARTMVRDARERLSTATVRIYAPNGEEVFGAPVPVPAADAMPPHVREVLASQAIHPPEPETAVIPVANDKACQKCHPTGDLRGVLTLGTLNATRALSDGDEALDVLSTVSESAFIQIMTADKDGLLDAYFAELAERVDGVDGVSVLNPEGDVVFGAALTLAESDLAAVYKGGVAQTLSVDGARVRVDPLPNETRCHACHDAEAVWRGVLATRVGAQLPDPRAALVAATDVSLRHVMLSGLGRMIARFLDEVAATGAVTKLTLHDGEGRLFRDAFAVPEPPKTVAATLESGKADSLIEHGRGNESLVFVVPLTNDPECIQCHGTDHDLRGAIEVTLDTSTAAASRKRVVVTGIVFAVATIVLTLLLLYFGLRTLVVRPVAEIGSVAQAVGQGQLDARVSVRTHDEIGRLGDQLNHMIGEIRAKIELSKFVSKATVGSVEAADAPVQRSGQRKRITVLFSDIRGFTSYSETVAPEAVVAMLNLYLDAQAQVVENHGGDIDKFVGDELMAHFSGENMEARAVACGVDMLAAVARVNAEAGPSGAQLQVGVGINVGEVVLGAMGARTRMDFTVIGDAVNVGARLCSAANGGQVLVSEAVHGAVDDPGTLRFAPIEPIAVKGKRAPLVVFAVSRVGDAAEPRPS